MCMALIRDPHNDFGRWRNVGHIAAEDTVSNALDDCSGVPGLGGGLIQLGRHMPFVDFPANMSVAYEHVHAVDGGIRWQGEDVDRFQPMVGRVVKALGDGGAHDRAMNGDLGVSPRPRTRHEFAPGTGPEEQAAVLDVVDFYRASRDAGLGDRVFLYHLDGSRGVRFLGGTSFRGPDRQGDQQGSAYLD